MMDLFTLQQQIREHKLLPFYVFTGEEIELQNIYLKQMGNIVRVHNIAAIYNKITSKLISGKFTIYVVRDDMDFIKSEKAWANISKKIKNAVLILQVTSPDKRSKFYKEMEKAIFTANQEARALELKVSNQTRTSEAEYAAAALMLARVEQREGDIEMEYYQKFERILSKKQLFQLKRAENKFTQYMLSHHRRSGSSK